MKTRNDDYSGVQSDEALWPISIFYTGIGLVLRQESDYHQSKDLERNVEHDT
jgi:hypothetical protein